MPSGRDPENLSVHGAVELELFSAAGGIPGLKNDACSI